MSNAVSREVLERQEPFEGADAATGDDDCGVRVMCRAPSPADDLAASAVAHIATGENREVCRRLPPCRSTEAASSAAGEVPMPWPVGGPSVGVMQRHARARAEDCRPLAARA